LVNQNKVVGDNNPQIKIGYWPQSLVIDSDKNRIYVANHDSDTVSVIDSNSGDVSGIPVGLHPLGIGIDPNIHRVYVANHDSGTVSNRWQ
jgi:YVTN family beta-propeller protein